MREALAPGLTETEKTMLCVPDIAAAEAERHTGADRQGWLHLHEMLKRWFAGKANTDAASGGEPYWVDWDWVMSYERARMAYEKFIDRNEDGNICSEKALLSLAKILCDEGVLKSAYDVVGFDFINSDYSRWQPLYHTYKGVEWSFGDSIDGLDAALAGFTLRALAKGQARDLGNGKWEITVTGIGVFVWDSFNFEEDTSLSGSLLNLLGTWNCELLAFNNPQGQLLSNGDFNTFRSKYGRGNDFLVLSKPHLVENFQETSYVTTCAKY